MDKKQLLRPNLARIMVELVSQIADLVQQHPAAPAQIKADGSPVTALDLALSELIERKIKNTLTEAVIYSEEKYSEWNFPLVAIDPLDGTKEYIEQRPEWAVSVGHFVSENFEGEGWVHNPNTKETFCGENPKPFLAKTNYRGEVSRSEWEKGLFKNHAKDVFQLFPVGSIAYKLGRLSEGKCDFVVSLAPKNIWDIAGGTLLCKSSGIKFWSQGKLVTKVQKVYQPPLIWTYEELYPQLSKIYR